MRQADDLWQPPPAALTLAHDTVHLWRADLRDVSEAHRASLQCTLSPDELSRAERFHFQQDRERFIVARGILRDILARYLNSAPEQLCFRYNACGKPALTTTGNKRVTFNMTHSKALAVYALARGREIGVDVERLRDNVEYEALAERFFSPRENAALRSLPEPMRRVAFFEGWTRKEAYLKAHGEGLALPLDQFDVSLKPDEPPQLLNANGDVDAPRRWSLWAFSPRPDYAGALAVEGQGWQIECWQWPA